jgi:signal transduction histidine kinase
MKDFDQETWKNNLSKFENLNLNRIYWPNDQRIPVPSKKAIDKIMKDMGKLTIEDELNCGACGYDTCREHALAIFKGLAENEMCLPHTIDQLKKTVKDLAVSNEQLETTQEALMQSEKLASMGQLAAGIAHEVNNPLGVVLMYSHMLQDECDTDSQMSDDLKMIAEQADRCKKIVAGLLHFARQNKVVLENHDIIQVITGCIKTIQIPDNVKLRIEHKIEDQFVEIDKDQILQVLTNLLNNAIGAMPDGGTLTITTEGDVSNLSISIKDTGVGIPEQNLNKIFEPFFTTKQIGIGTGLGLAVTYGIIKMHRGNIKVESNTDPASGPTGTKFTVVLPRNGMS